MNRGKRFIISILDKCYSVERKILPKNLLRRLRNYITATFKEEAITVYTSDHKDIGFFESFILGADETKKISNETNKTFAVIKKTEMIEKLAGYIPSKNLRRNQETEVVKDNIDSRKKRVIEILQERDEVIKYLGRRIVGEDEVLYSMLERLYNKLNEDAI